MTTHAHRAHDRHEDEGGLSMSHTTKCAVTVDPLNPDRRCTCHEPDTDWAPNEPCGGISTNGAEPPLCEVHMKPWGHRRNVTPDPRATARETTEPEGGER